MCYFNKALVLFFLIVSAVGCSETSTNGDFDGYWWLRKDEESRSAIAVGIFMGMFLGNRISTEKVDNESCVQAANQSFKDVGGKLFSKMSGVLLADGINKFYSEKANRKISIDVAARIVALQNLASSEAGLEKEIAQERARAEQ